MQDFCFEWIVFSHSLVFTSVRDLSIDKYSLYFTFWQLWYSLVILADGQWRQQLVHGLQLKHPAASAPLTLPELTAAVSSLLAPLVLAQGAPASYCSSVMLSSEMAAVKKCVTFSSFATNFLFSFLRLTSVLCSFPHRAIQFVLLLFSRITCTCAVPWNIPIYGWGGGGLS